MRDALVLTLGHGASAILILNSEIVNGYQLERLTGVKGDSRFPALCIEEIEKTHKIPDDIQLIVSHWHPTGVVSNMSAKHWNQQYLERRFPNSQVLPTNSHLTHHDTHAYSALAYNPTMAKDSHVLVADGFGTFGEVMSLYIRHDDDQPLQLVRRAFGYSGSLGLLYQYATDYVGLKQNQDEWKLNAYANSCDKDRHKRIEQLAVFTAKQILQTQFTNTIALDDPVTNLGALSYTHKSVVDMLKPNFPPEDKEGIALFLQLVVEKVLMHWLIQFNVWDCTLVGGCFLNVQLNGYLGRHLKSICVMPLSGDEGAGLGLYKYFNPDFRVPSDLCWGRRTMDSIHPVLSGLPKKMFVTTDSANIVHEYLKLDKIVNVIRGNMEYGPRAYCNTSTLALPTEENKAYINKLNDRDPRMPMCPVMSTEQYSAIADVHFDIARSIQHMILAVPIREWAQDLYPGIEYDTGRGEITMRPQVVQHNHWIYPVVKSLGPLINTSFNNHGQPIVYTFEQICAAHNFMLKHDVDDRVVTIIDITETF